MIFFKTLITILICVFCICCVSTSTKPPPKEISVVPLNIAPVRVAIPFKTISPSYQFSYLSYYLPDILKGQLGALGIPVVAREQELSHILKEQVFTIEMGKEETEIVSFAGAKFIVIGSWEKIENILYLQVEIYDTESGVSKGVKRVSGKIEDLYFLVKEAAISVAELLGIKLSTEAKINFWAEFPECRKNRLEKVKKCFKKKAKISKKDLAKFSYKMPIQVKVTLSNYHPYPGDKLEIDIETNRPCFPYIFTVFCKDKVGRIFPDNITPLASPVRYFHYPSAEAKKAGYIFQVIPDPNCPEKYRFKEKILVICLEKKDLQLEQLTEAFIFKNLNDFNQANSLSLLIDYLSHLPKESWGWAEAVYSYSN